MSRCSDASRRPGRRVGRAATVGAGLLAAVLAPLSATADSTLPVLPIQPAVVTIVAPVIDIQFGESDLKGEAQVEQLPTKTKITLDSTVLFGKDSAKINAAANGRLREVAAQLKARGPGKLQVTGYTDDLGSAAHGKTLSRQRANAVATVLRRDLSGTGYSFTVVGKGEADPAVPNTNERNRRINRRVVVLYQKA